MLAAAGFWFGLLSAVFTIQVDFSEPHSHAYRSAVVLDGAFLALFLAAALIAASGFSQPNTASATAA